MKTIKIIKSVKSVKTKITAILLLICVSMTTTSCLPEITITSKNTDNTDNTDVATNRTEKIGASENAEITEITEFIITETENTAARETADNNLTLEILRQRAVAAEYEPSDAYGYDDTDNTPRPANGFSFSHKYLFMSVSVLEFSSADDAQKYKDMMHDDERRHIHVSGKFAIDIPISFFDDDFTADRENAVISALFSGVIVSEDDNGENVVNVTTDGSSKLPQAEIDRINVEIDGDIFRTVPSNGKETTFAALNEMTAKLAKTQGSGNTTYMKFLEANYTSENGGWEPYSVKRINEIWENEDIGAKAEFLYLWSSSEPEKVGDTECFIKRLEGSEYKEYYWLKSQNVSSQFMVYIDTSLSDGETLPDYDGMKYMRYADQTVNGHSCKVYGIEGETGGVGIYLWFAEDLGRLLMIETIYGTTMILSYSYDLQYIDTDASFYEPPSNVTFEKG